MGWGVVARELEHLGQRRRGTAEGLRDGESERGPASTAVCFFRSPRKSPRLGLSMSPPMRSNSEKDGLLAAEQTAGEDRCAGRGTEPNSKKEVLETRRRTSSKRQSLLARCSLLPVPAH